MVTAWSHLQLLGRKKGQPPKLSLFYQLPLQVCQLSGIIASNKGHMYNSHKAVLIVCDAYNPVKTDASLHFQPPTKLTSQIIFWRKSFHMLHPKASLKANWAPGPIISIRLVSCLAPVRLGFKPHPDICTFCVYLGKSTTVYLMVLGPGSHLLIVFAPKHSK